MDRYIGKLLDNRYEIQEIIGTGGMAVVYKALCHRLNRPVAVKILKDELFQDAEFRRRFHAESQAVAMLSHPNIVSVYDVSHTDNADYIVMELIDGITLKQYLQSKAVLNWREALHFGTQICKALEHAHSRGIIHRDIKPHNIMLLKDGSVKVADFGIARITSAQSTLTREALGSVHYISPEQAKGSKIDCRSDLYSLGVVMYEMLTGRPPFDGDTPVSVAIQHINAKATMPREINPSIPEGLEQITMRAMESDMSVRYPSASQLLQDLESFRQNPSILFKPAAVEEPVEGPKPAAAPIRPQNNEKKPVKKQNKKSRSAVIAGIICIVLAVTGFAALLVMLMGDTFKRSEDVTVPDLHLAQVETLEELYGENFEFEIAWTPHEEVGYGQVITHDPKADMTVKKGSTIEVTASLGLQQTAMPNLVNYHKNDAETVLSSFDVKVKITYEDHDLYVKDYVIRTEPEYGTSLSPGQDVTLVVSNGASKELVPVPELIGMDVEEAIAAIDELELGKGNIKYVDSNLPAGTVTFQSIDQGEQVKKGTIINLQVAKGPEEKAQVPTIVGQPASMTIEKDEAAALSVSATVSDSGTLTYEWFVSVTGATTDLQPAGTGAILNVPTDAIGTRSYCCKISNTLGESVVSIYTNMVKVTVEKRVEPVLKTLLLTLPEGQGPANIVIKLDGRNYMTPFTADRSEGTIEIAVEAAGTHVVDIYVDGLLTPSRTVEFTAE